MGVPYRWGHYAAAVVLFVTVFGFWPSFFASLRDAPLAFHVHGATATAWIALVGLQSYSIHARKIVLHRRVGVSSLFLFPLLIVGLVMIINVSAKGFLQSGNPYYQALGPAFGWGLAIAVLAYLWLYYQALLHRKIVVQHAGFMLSTLFLIWEAPVSRLILRNVPSMSVEGPADFPNISHAVVLGISMAVVVAILLYLRSPRQGRPFLVVAGFMAAQIVGFVYLADTQWWRAIFAAYAKVSAELTVGIALVIGALTAWLGWRKPRLARKTSSTTA